MAQEQVNVLISSYNGEKYIREQIESIKAQTYDNIKIYVRDDGSSDGTIDILKEYESTGDIELIVGENVRWGKSFMILLEVATEGDYWAFCDQDDVWFPEKIQWAVEWMKSRDRQKPLLFHGSYELTNEDMTETTGIYTVPEYAFDFRRSLTDCLYQGFSIVLNRPLRELMLQGDKDVITSHDGWACLLITKFGESFFDPRIASKHRRLENSMSGGNLSSKIKWFFDTMKNGSSDIKGCAQEFVRLFGDSLITDDEKMVNLFANEKYNVVDAVKKAFYPKRWRASISSEVSIRILMLLGKV